MAAVPQATLNWLYNALKREYRDSNRTYSDLANTLSVHPGFNPRTDVYTSENGSSALLIHFVGTVPASFRGTTYRFPVALWIPHSYPYEAPLVYVTPTDSMTVRPGQHVGGDGRVYHHYLAHWGDSWDRSNIVELLSILSGVFAKEPPVIAKGQQQNPSHRPLQGGGLASGPPPLPPLPQELQSHPAQLTRSSPPQSSGPPRPPPKTLPQPATPSTFQTRPGRYDAPPSLPSKGSRSPNNQSYSMPSPGAGQQPPGRFSYAPQRSSSVRSHQQYTQEPSPINQPPHSQQTHGPPQPTDANMPPYPQHMQFSAPTDPSFHYQHSQQPHVAAIPRQQLPQANPPQFQPQPYPPAPYQSQPPQQSAPISHPQLIPHKAPAPNLLDSPFDIPLPATTHPLPAPPVPRNPEKEALLHHLSQTFTSILQHQVTQHNAALSPLQSQTTSMSHALSALHTEQSHLQSLHTTLTSNISLLHASLSKADKTIKSATHQSQTPQGLPRVDDLLTAPNVAAKQLYDVVCDERGVEAALRALLDGLVGGRIGSEVWSRRTRELAREGFRKRVLKRKIAVGMGLEGLGGEDGAVEGY